MKKINVTSMDMWTSELETIALISSYAKFFRSKSALEIGTFRGDATLKILEDNPKIKITTIDIKDYFSEVLNRLPVNDKDRVNFFICNSSGLKSKVRRKFDFIYIDAEHHFLPCLLDWINIIPLLKYNSVVVMHDTLNSFFPGVGYVFRLIENINLLCCKKFGFSMTFPTAGYSDRPNSGISFFFIRYLTSRKRMFLLYILKIIYYISLNLSKIFLTLRSKKKTG